MSGAFIYYDPSGAWTQNLGTAAVRLGSIAGLREVASLGEPGDGAIIIDDPLGTQGHSSDGITGLKTFKWTESSAPVNDQIIWIGYVADRDYYTDDSLITGVARKIGVQLVELNAAFGFEVIRPGVSTNNRPSETVNARLAWLLATGYLDAFNNGLVASSTVVLDANDYRNTYPLQVMQDIADATGFNFFLYYDEAATQISLFLDDFNTSTAYTSSLKLSNVLSDLDTLTPATFLTGTTFAPYNNHVGVSPLRVASGGSMPYASASIYASRPATATAFALRDKIFPNSNVKTAAMATRQLNRMLRENSTEDPSVTCSVDLPAAKVNAIRRGHRIPYRNRWMASPVDYTADTWMRVVERTVKQDKMTDDRYTLDLRLSPMEQPCSGATDLNLAATVTYDAARSNDAGHAGGWNNPTLANDNNVVTFAYINNGFGNGSAMALYLKSDLGADYTVQSFEIIDEGDTDAMPGGGLGNGDIYYSTDGITLVAIPYTFSGAYAAYLTGGATLTFTTPVTARYFYVMASCVASEYINRCDIETWAVMGCS